MASTNTLFHIMNSLDAFINEIPILDFDKDNIELWATEVNRILGGLGLTEEWRKPLRPIELLLFSLDDHAVLSLSEIITDNLYVHFYDIGCMIIRFIICSRVSDEVREMLCRHFKCFDPVDNEDAVDGFPRGWCQRLQELYNEHVAQAAADRDKLKQQREARKAKKREKKCNELRREVAAHNREIERLEEELRVLEEMRDSNGETTADDSLYSTDDSEEDSEEDSEMEDSD